MAGNFTHSPEPGQYPDFDSKVASEFLRLRDATKPQDNENASREERDRESHHYLGSSPAAASFSSLDPPQAFEADVERAMQNLELQLAGNTEGTLGDFGPASAPLRKAEQPAATGGRRGQALNGSGRNATANGAPATRPPPIPASNGPPLSAPDPPPAPRPADSRHEGILSQMEMHRAARGGRGRFGGLRNMWDGSVEDAQNFRQQQQRRYGSGLGGMWQEEARDTRDDGAPVGRRHSQRQGPGLKEMWGGDDPTTASTIPPQRQGPGLRGLWSGPDMAAEDAARIEAQSAYLRALDRDVQERERFSSDPQQQQAFSRYSGIRAPNRVGRRRDIDYGGDDSASEHGTSLAGIGAIPGMVTPTPRGEAPRQRWESEGGGMGDHQDRLIDKAKKAAYAGELRKQISEKETRKVNEKKLSTGYRRRASTGEGGGGVDGTVTTPQPYGYRDYTYQNVTDAASRYPAPNDTHRQLPNDDCNSRFPGVASAGRDGLPNDCSTPLPSSLETDTLPQNSSSAPRGLRKGDAHVTAARRRLVEDVYGGGEMGAALSGSGYRRASTGSYSAVNGITHGVIGVDQIGGGNSADAVTAEDGASHLRMGTGVQSLNETEQNDKWQRREAALEQQRALQEQIAAKATAKKEEDCKRKQEEEEEARCVPYYGSQR